MTEHTNLANLRPLASHVDSMILTRGTTKQDTLCICQWYREEPCKHAAHCQAALSQQDAARLGKLQHEWRPVKLRQHDMAHSSSNRAKQSPSSISSSIDAFVMPSYPFCHAITSSAVSRLVSLCTHCRRCQAGLVGGPLSLGPCQAPPLPD